MAKRSTTDDRGVNRRALVTGASSGIGAAFAQQLARQRYDLIAVARHREALEALAKDLRNAHGVAVEVLPADLTEAAELRVVEQVAADAHLDLLVNNAGLGTVGTFAQLPIDDEDREIRLNVVALVRLARAVLPGMIARRQGAIVNVSSLAAFQPNPYNATYGATKAFVNSFTEALHEELRGTGVVVQALCPGFTRTSFQERAGIDARNIPDAVWMEPETVVQAALAGLRRHDVVCVPGIGNHAVATLVSILPRSVTRRIVAGFVRRLRS